MLKIIAAVLLLSASAPLFAESLDDAIKRFMPMATDTIADVPPTKEILIQTKAAVKAAQQVAPSDELDKLAALIETLTEGELISEEDTEALISQLAAFANANSAVYSSVEQHQLINSVVQQTMKALPTKMELIAFPAQISPNGYSNLMWVSTHNDCQISGQIVTAAGSMRVGPLSDTHQFSLNCRNEFGQSSVKTVTINVVAPKPAVTDSNAEPSTTQESADAYQPTGPLRAISATASGSQALSNGEAYVASNVIDGDLSSNSRWANSGIGSSAEKFDWITLDLGEKRSLNTLRIAFYKYDTQRIYDYDIAVSTDNKNWKAVVTHAKSAATPWTTQSFKTVVGQYIKVTIHSASDNTRWANIYEIEVFNHKQATQSKEITLKWASNEDKILGYKIYYGLTPERIGKNVIHRAKLSSADFDPSAPSFTFDSVTDLGLAEGDQVCFAIRAYDSEEMSELSEPVCGWL